MNQLKPTPVVATFYKTSMTSQSCSISDRRGGEGGAGADGKGVCGNGGWQMGFRVAATPTGGINNKKNKTMLFRGCVCWEVQNQIIMSCGLNAFKRKRWGEGNFSWNCQNGVRRFTPIDMSKIDMQHMFWATKFPIKKFRL